MVVSIPFIFVRLLEDSSPLSIITYTHQGQLKNTKVKENQYQSKVQVYGLALYHKNFFSRQDDDMTWHWQSSTLNPYYEGNTTNLMINDDRLVFHTLDHWDFGPSDTGDILDRDNRVQLMGNIKRKLHGRVDLVTADGSVDCQANPADQVRNFKK